MEGSQQLAITPVRTFDRASALAIEARRRGLLTALNWMCPTLTIKRLDALLIGNYADELGAITIEQLTEPTPRNPVLPRPDESIEDAVMRVFESLPQQRLSSGSFVRHMGLARWTAQSLLAKLSERGLLVRDGKTSTTRYRLADERADVSTDDE